MTLEIITPLCRAIDGGQSPFIPERFEVIDDPLFNRFGSEYTQSFRRNCKRPDLFLYRVRTPLDADPDHAPLSHTYVLGIWLLRPAAPECMGLASALESLNGHPDWYAPGCATNKPSAPFLTLRLRTHPKDKLRSLITKLDTDRATALTARVATNEHRTSLSTHFARHTHPHDPTSKLIARGEIPVPPFSKSDTASKFNEARLRTQSQGITLPGVPTNAS